MDLWKRVDLQKDIMTGGAFFGIPPRHLSLVPKTWILKSIQNRNNTQPDVSRYCDATDAEIQTHKHTVSCFVIVLELDPQHENRKRQQNN